MLFYSKFIRDVEGWADFRYNLIVKICNLFFFADAHTCKNKNSGMYLLVYLQMWTKYWIFWEIFC